MDKNFINNEIVEKINSLNIRNYPPSFYSERIDKAEENKLIEETIRKTKRQYRLNLVLSIISATILFIAGSTQIFEISFIDLRKSGLLIVMTISFSVNMYRLRFDIERLNTIKYLIELKNKIND